ncbi:hypothetical protein WMY93_012337 [Mugilogobius chulae]|uniref:CFA20 domain-containing protein n=1 Tax=Mugilogobius chulae TaxID=88201 RepID=A0AAW0PGI3_9GOBI
MLIVSSLRKLQQCSVSLHLKIRYHRDDFSVRNVTANGGAVVEIFCAQGKDPAAKWKLSGGAIHKEYNKEIKGFVYCLEGSSQTVKMQIPKNGKMSFNVPPSRDFSIELTVTDTDHLKRRLYLSTVHKELSTTLWHAKIPLVGLNYNIWSTLCIDLVSFTRKLFKDVAFVSLDRITLYANCSIRRIFTMKAEPKAGDEMFLSGGGLMEWIPRSCHFPHDIKHITQVLNIENLKKTETADAALAQTAGVAGTRSCLPPKSRPPGILQSASGLRALGSRPQSEVKSHATSDTVEGSALCASYMGSVCCKLNPKSKARNQSNFGQHEKHSQRDSSPSLREVQCIGTAGILQPHPSRTCDKSGSKIPRLFSPGKPKLASRDDMPPKKTNNPKPCTPSCSRQGSRQEALSLIEETELLAADKRASCAVMESPEAPVRGEVVSVPTEVPFDLSVCCSWDSNEEAEPQLYTHQSVFTFCSPPHTPTQRPGRVQEGHTDKHWEGQDGRRGGAQPEDDFIGSESDEDEEYLVSSQQRNTTDSGLGASRCSDETLNDVFFHSQSPSTESGTNSPVSQSITKMEPPGFVPKRCLSPSSSLSRPSVIVNSSVSLSRRLLQEVRMVPSEENKNEGKAVFGHSDGLQLLQDEDEMRMLASLKREQRQWKCHVSLSVSSDDTSTWTTITMPDQQGHHYQKEMNPLLNSNPREWMDVLSPPIMAPGQRRRSQNTWDNQQDLVGEADKRVIEENEEEYLNLLYDPCLNCYFDPKSGKYYELA